MTFNVSEYISNSDSHEVNYATAMTTDANIVDIDVHTDDEISKAYTLHRMCEWKTYHDAWGRYRLIRKCDWFDKDGQRSTPDTMAILTFDGIQIRSKSVDRHNANIGHAGTIADRRTREADYIEHYMELFRLWQGWSVLQLSEQLSLCDLIQQNAAEAAVVINDDGVAECRFHDKRRHLDLVIKYRLCEDAIIKLLFVRADYFRSSNGNREHAGYIEGHFDYSTHGASGDGGLLDRCVLANNAMIEVGQTRPDGTIRRMRQYVELVGIEAVVGKAEVEFREPFEAPMTVIDTRYSISYTLGQKWINFDGKILEVSEPLFGDVGDNLEKWLHAKPLRGTSIIDDSRTRHNPD